MDDLITTQEAAAELGVTPRRVLALIATGQLAARTVGNSRVHLIARADLDAVRHRKPGRPATKADAAPAAEPAPLKSQRKPKGKAKP